MSLRTLPTSERLFATFVLLALGLFLAGGLDFALRQERAAGAAAPPARPRLIAVLEGVMAPNTNPAQVALFRTWVQGGATREGYAPVETVVSNNCASCHGEGGQYPRITTFEDARSLALEEASESLYATLGTRGLHLAAFPLVFLALAVLYLRRLRWPGRHLLMGGCAVAVLFDAILWWMRQGHPGTTWAPRTALGLLAVAYLAAAAFVLAEVWRRSTEDLA